MQNKHSKSLLARWFPVCWRDLSLTLLILIIASAICMRLQQLTTDGFASPVFVLSVVLIARLTTGYLFGFMAAITGVICVNYIFTYPYWELDFTLTGYPLTSVVFLAVSVMTSALTTQVRQQERLRSETEKEKMRANLLRSVSHDIRTPLTSIVGSTSAVLENPELTREEQQELLTDARDEAQWLIRVVENLLYITRMGDAQANIAKEPEAAEEVLVETVRKFRKRFPDIKVSIQIPDDLLLVAMDPILIEQVLSNLLENAVFHGNCTTRIQVAVQTDDRYARFSVTDNGNGIPEHILPNLFDGTLKHNESADGDGRRSMGLGLSVCMAIVRAHNGTMNAKNTDTGAEFSFRLPLFDEEVSL